MYVALVKIFLVSVLMGDVSCLAGPSELCGWLVVSDSTSECSKVCEKWTCQPSHGVQSTVTCAPISESLFNMIKYHSHTQNRLYVYYVYFKVQSGHGSLAIYDTTSHCG